MFKLILILLIATGTSVFGQTNSGGSTQVTGTTSQGDFEKVGSAGGQFLKIPIGGRGVGMGGAFSSVVDDASAIYWNPAGLYGVDNTQVYVAHSTWFGDFTNNFASAVVSVADHYRIAAFVQTFGANDIPVTTINRPEGTGSFYSVNDMAIGLSFAGALTSQFTFGVTAKYVQNAFETVSANGVAFDVGTQYDTELKGIKLGFSIMNLSTETSYKGSALERESDRIEGETENPDNPLGTPNYGIIIPAYPFSLPVIFRGGISSEVWANDRNSLLLSGDIITISDAPEQFALGMDYTWNEILSIRGGYYFNNDQINLSGGVGLTYLSGGFDGTFEYSASNTASFGIIHRLNILMDF